MTASSSSAERGLRVAALVYKTQRAYVAMMFDVLGRLLVAGSAADPVIQRELLGFPEGYTIGFAVLGEDLSLRVARVGTRFVQVADKDELSLPFGSQSGVNPRVLAA
jgi:hypothetical protein